MRKRFTIAAIVLVTTAAMAPARAHELLGIALNGPELAGIALNDPEVASFTLPGIALNGPDLAGIALNGPSLRGQVGPLAVDEAGMRVVELRQLSAAK